MCVCDFALNFECYPIAASIALGNDQDIEFQHFQVIKTRVFQFLYLMKKNFRSPI